MNKVNMVKQNFEFICKTWMKCMGAFASIHDIIQFVNTFYGISYAENSRETFRKQELHVPYRCFDRR